MNEKGGAMMVSNDMIRARIDVVAIIIIPCSVHHDCHVIICGRVQ
jgi:hypothetical protein